MGIDPIIVVGALLAFAVGAGLGFWLGTARQSRKVMQAGAMKAEYDEYREQVTRHFGQAAEHFQTIGREYRALYEHMASGADALCAVRDASNKLSFVPGDGESDVAAADAEPAGDDADSAPQKSPESTAENDASREHSADGNQAQDEVAPRTGSAAPKAADDGPRAEQDGPAADKPERTYH